MVYPSSIKTALSENKNEEIFAILDGQQRLTSLYIGLKGSYAEKLAHKRWNNENAYPEKKLYLNLLSTSKDADKNNSCGKKWH